jgi:hypothetical protein
VIRGIGWVGHYITQAWAAVCTEQLEKDDYSEATLGTLTQMLKKHEAFKSELDAKKPHVDALGSLAAELEGLRYSEVVGCWLSRSIPRVGLLSMCVGVGAREC